MVGRGEAFHRPFPLSGGLVGVLRHRYSADRCSAEGITTRCAAPSLRSLSVTITRGTYRNPLRRQRKNFLVDFALHRVAQWLMTFAWSRNPLYSMCLGAMWWWHRGPIVDFTAPRVAADRLRR
jgi:hypothetical protein